MKGYLLVMPELWISDRQMAIGMRTRHAMWPLAPPPTVTAVLKGPLAFACRYNYSYLLDLVFHTNGVIEHRFYASGYPQSGFFEHPDEDHLFGDKMRSNAGGTIHLHQLSWKIDLDVAGRCDLALMSHACTNPLVPTS